MASHFQKDIRRTTIVSSQNLLKKEHLCVGFDGSLVAAKGDHVYGIISRGRTANMGSEIVYEGQFEAYVDPSGATIAADQPLTGGGSGAGTNDGDLVKNDDIGSYPIVAITMESVTSRGKVKVFKKS